MRPTRKRDKKMKKQKETKKFGYLTLIIFSVIAVLMVAPSCIGCSGSSNSKSVKLNYTDDFYINMDCVGAKTKSDFDRMRTSLSRNDKATFDRMLYIEGTLVDLWDGNKIKIVEIGFEWAKVRVDRTGQELYVLSNCIRR